MARLTEVFRQAAQSRIVINAHRINRGHVPELDNAAHDTDFYFVEAADADEVVQDSGNRLPPGSTELSKIQHENSLRNPPDSARDGLFL